jgi:hypothetical protein
MLGVSAAARCQLQPSVSTDDALYHCLNIQPVLLRQLLTSFPTLLNRTGYADAYRGWRTGVWGWVARRFPAAAAADASGGAAVPAGPRQALLERREALHLGGVTYLGLVLAASSGAAHLCSGNLLVTRAQAALLTAPTLSEACILHIRARVINNVSRAR